MKNTIKSLALALSVLLFTLIPAFSQDAIESTFNGSATGTTSATAFVPKGSQPGEITDINWRLDTGTTTGFISIKIPRATFLSTSATTATGSVIWFSNTSTTVVPGDFIILFDFSANTGAPNYFLHKVSASTTTSATVQPTVTPALTTDDIFYHVPAANVFERPVVTSATSSHVSIWVQSNMPAAITLDGNTTACRIQFSGNRSAFK